MRPRIVDLNVDEIEWAPLGPPGLYSRLLSRDPETGARTALQKLVPQDGYTPPSTAHYHHTYEEIIGVSGCFSFDSRRWVVPGTYVFHPPQTVHGFASAIREESTFLSRVGRDLDFNFVEEPEHDDLYPVEGASPARAATALDPHETIGATNASMFLNSPASTRVLSTDPDSGEGSAFVSLPPGWTGASPPLGCYLEIFVLSGPISVDARVPGAGRRYFFYPPHSSINALAVPADAQEPVIAYVNFGGAISI